MEETKTIKTGKHLFLRVLLNIWKRKFFKNPIDKKIENFLHDFAKNEDLNKVMKSEYANKVYFFMFEKISELAEFQHLYLEIILPEQKRYLEKMKRYAKRSFYMKLFNKSGHFDDGVFEVTRIGYVHLYHKYESFRQELLISIDDFVSTHFKKNISVRAFLKEFLFGYDIFDLEHQPAELRKINWICNCVKHYDGLPLKSNPPPHFKDVDKTQKLKIGADEFKVSILFMYGYFGKLFNFCLFSGTAAYGIQVQKDEGIVDIGKKEFNIKLKVALFMEAMIMAGKLPGLE